MEEVEPKKDERPYVIFNAAMSLDGQIGTAHGGGNFSSPEDWARVHKLRASVDAILVGIGTVLVDNPALTARVEPRPVAPPLRVILDSHLRIPLEAKVLSPEAPTLVACCGKVPEDRWKELDQKGVSLWHWPEESQVPLKALLKRLFSEKGVRKLLLEGGGHVAYSFLRHQLVDEIHVAISPLLLGCEGGTSLVHGPAVTDVSEGAQLQLLRHYPLGNCLVLEYKVLSPLEK